MPKLRTCVCLAALCALGGCIPDTAPSNGMVFAGPADLPLHEDALPRSKVVTRVHHGDQLNIVQQRRRLYKLRTSTGVEGWTDERNLMSVEQMRALKQLEERALRLPSQGAAGTYETLNVHTEPQRYSPSFTQIKEGEKFDVIAHETATRAEPKHRVLVKPQPKAPAREKKTSHSPLSRHIPPPPLPPPPPPPDDWLELSQEREAPEPVKKPVLNPVSKNSRGKKEEPEVAPLDDWTLVRTAKGAAGWVLTNRIYLAIPDEVAQYAEGHRITTYFSLGKIHDSEQNVYKDIWLWTTIHAGQHPYDFDSFRVFTWNPHRHRYETSYQLRNIEGYLPINVEKKDGEVMFSVCMDDDDGVRWRKRYRMEDRLVKAVDVTSCEQPKEVTKEELSPAGPTPAKAPESITEKLKNKLGIVKKQMTGR